MCGLVKAPRNDELFINPHSVTAADILYLCNTTNYLERYMYIIGIIIWAKRYGCNLLRYIKVPMRLATDLTPAS